MSPFEEAIESLYDLNRAELRAVAWEALLMSDGPDHVGGYIKSTPIKVHNVSVEHSAEVNTPHTVPIFVVTSPRL